MTARNATDGSYLHRIVGADRSLRFSSSEAFADHWNIDGAENGRRTFLTVEMNGTPFGDHVGHVVGLGSEEQVCRIAARRVVTGMKTLEAIGNRAVREFVGNTVSEHIFAIDPEGTISPAGERVGPRPAIVWATNFDLGPETLRQGNVYTPKRRRHARSIVISLPMEAAKAFG